MIIFQNLLRWKTPVFLFLYIFSITLTGLYYIASGTPIISSDSFTYLRLAEEMQKGRFYIEQWGSGSLSVPPLFPFTVALAQKIISNPFIAGALISFISSIGIVIIAYILAKSLYGFTASNIAIILMIANPFFITFSLAILTESLFTFFFILNIFLIYKISQNHIENLFICCFAIGATSALAWHTRDVGIVTIIISSAWLIYFLKIRLISSFTVLKYLSFFILGFLIFFTPFIILLKSNPNLNSYNNTAKHNILKILAAPSLNNQITREMTTRSLTEDGSNYSITANSQEKITLNDFIGQFDWVIKKFLLGGGKIVLYVLAITAGFGIFTIINLIISIRGKNKILSLFFLSIILLYISFYAASGTFFGAVGPKRYLLPLFPLLIILASGGIKISFRFVIERLKIRRMPTPAFLFFVVGIGAILLFPLSIKQNNADAQKNFEYQNIAETLDAFKNEKTIIMSGKPYLPFFLHASFVSTPYADYEKVIQFAKIKKVNLIFIEKSLYAPQLEFLKDSNDSTEELKFMLSTAQGNLYKVIY